MQNLKPNTFLNTANFVEKKAEGLKESAHEFKKGKMKDYFQLVKHRSRASSTSDQYFNIFLEMAKILRIF